MGLVLFSPEVAAGMQPEHMAYVNSFEGWSQLTSVSKASVFLAVIGQEQLITRREMSLVSTEISSRMQSSKQLSEDL